MPETRKVGRNWRGWKWNHQQFLYDYCADQRHEINRSIVKYTIPWLHIVQSRANLFLVLLASFSFLPKFSSDGRICVLDAIGVYELHNDYYDWGSRRTRSLGTLYQMTYNGTNEMNNFGKKKQIWIRQNSNSRTTRLNTLVNMWSDPQIIAFHFRLFFWVGIIQKNPKLYLFWQIIRYL